MEILTIRLTDWAETNNVLDESQAGFRKGYSTMDNVFSLQALQALVQKYLCRDRGRFYCRFIDFKRAFDSIQHSNLWNSLERKGIKQDGIFFLFLLYKIINNLAPKYLMQLLPPRVQQFSRYPLRNSEDFAIPVTRIATYYNSFLPTALRDWKILGTLPPSTASNTH